MQLIHLDTKAARPSIAAFHFWRLSSGFHYNEAPTTDLIKMRWEGKVGLEIWFSKAIAMVGSIYGVGS